MVNRDLPRPGDALLLADGSHPAHVSQPLIQGPSQMLSKVEGREPVHRLSPGWELLTSE